jgi:putative transposase
MMHDFKIKYSRHYRDKYGLGRIWQNRFWDHVIRDARDFENHLHYIHYNPVKHGYTKDPFEYAHSSLMLHYKNGVYDRNWGAKEEIKIDGEFGE